MKKASKKERKVYGWHFVGTNRRLKYGDDRLVEPGQVYSVDCAPELCMQGLHASRNPLDAYRYHSTYGYACRVRLWGDLDEGSDKMVARNREVLWMAELTATLLRKFACLCALDVAHLWNPPEIVLKYLKTQNELIRAQATDAAYAADADAYRAKQNRRFARMLSSLPRI